MSQDFNGQNVLMMYGKIGQHAHFDTMSSFDLAAGRSFDELVALAWSRAARAILETYCLKMQIPFALTIPAKRVNS